MYFLEVHLVINDTHPSSDFGELLLASYKKEKIRQSDSSSCLSNAFYMRSAQTIRSPS